MSATEMSRLRSWRASPDSRSGRRGRLAVSRSCRSWRSCSRLLGYLATGNLSAGGGAGQGVIGPPLPLSAPSGEVTATTDLPGGRPVATAARGGHLLHRNRPTDLAQPQRVSNNGAGPYRQTRTGTTAPGRRTAGLSDSGRG